MANETNRLATGYGVEIDGQLKSQGLGTRNWGLGAGKKHGAVGPRNGVEKPFSLVPSPQPLAPALTAR